MDLDSAQRHIKSCLERMGAAYLSPVFDEWAILALPTKSGGILAYEGPRPERFRRELPTDAELLRSESAGKKLTEGDIEFVADATGTRYDAFIKIGAGSYLVLNNTKKSMTEIRADTKWLGTQKILFELTEKFRMDPVEA